MRRERRGDVCARRHVSDSNHSGCSQAAPEAAASLRRRRAPCAAAEQRRSLTRRLPRLCSFPSAPVAAPMPDAVPFVAVTAEAVEAAAEFEIEAAEDVPGAAQHAAGATSAARAYWELARRNFKKVRVMRVLRCCAGAFAQRARRCARAAREGATRAALHAPAQPPQRRSGRCVWRIAATHVGAAAFRAAFAAQRPPSAALALSPHNAAPAASRTGRRPRSRLRRALRQQQGGAHAGRREPHAAARDA